MNVLILTPDRVGSTLLQRLITIYMLRYGFNKPVINVHELTNGISKFYNPTLQQETLCRDDTIGYGTSLPNIQKLLSSVDHYTTSRLAHYHLIRRNDPIEQQTQFFKYLNENFYIISCRRENLFEHALSWIIFNSSKKLNVYSAIDKIQTFEDLYKNGITAHKESIFARLNAYKNYITWSDIHFDVQSYFNYESYIHDLESYILTLDFMPNSKNNTWHDMFGIEFINWNKMHKAIPDAILKNNNKDNTENFRYLSHHDITKYKSLSGSDWPTPEEWINNKLVNTEIHNEICNYFPNSNLTVSKELYNFLSTHAPKYKETNAQLDELQTNGFLPTGVPIKLQTLKEKISLIKNFEDCIDWYNEWVERNEFGAQVSKEDFKEIISSEEEINSYNLKLRHHKNSNNLLT